MIGYLFTDNILGGIQLEYSRFKQGTRKSSNTGINFFGRYYIPFKKIYVYGHAEFGFLKVGSSNFFLSSTDGDFSFGGGAGIAYFLNDNIAIDVLPNIRRLGGSIDRTILTFKVGITCVLY